MSVFHIQGYRKHLKTSPAMVVVNGEASTFVSHVCSKNTTEAHFPQPERNEGCGIMFLMQGIATYIIQHSKIPKTCLRDYLCSLHCSTAPVPYHTTVVCLSASARRKSTNMHV